MKNHHFIRFRQWTLLVICVVLLTAGCSKPDTSWDFGLLSKENDERQRSSGEVLVLFSNLSNRFATLLENLGGDASNAQMNQLMKRLSEATTVNLTFGDQLAIQYNHQQIKILSATAAARLGDLSAQLTKLNQKKATLSPKQIILLDRLLEEYANNIEELLLEAETSKKNQMDGIDVETLKGFSAENFIAMQQLEMETLSTLNDYLKEVTRVLKLSQDS